MKVHKTPPDQPGKISLPDSITSAVAEVVAATSVPRMDNLRGGRLHVVHSWGGGIDHWVNDFTAASNRPEFVLRSMGSRTSFGQMLVLYSPDSPDTPILAWSLATSIVTTAVEHAEYRSIVQGIVDSFGIEEIVVSSLIGHSLDSLTLDLPTLVVTHDYYPYCLGIALHFGEVCTSCDATRLSFCLSANELHPFRGMTDTKSWMMLRERYLDCLARPYIKLVAPDRSVREHLVSLNSRYSKLDWHVIPHGTYRASVSLSSWAGVDLQQEQPPLARPLRVLVLGRLNAHKGKALLLSLAEQAATDVQFILLGCGRFGLEFEGLPAVERIVPNYSVSELEDLVREIAPDCGLLLSLWPETFSYTLSELIAFGIPPVATRLGAFASRIRHGESGFLCRPEASEIMGLLLDLREHPERLSTMAAQLLTENTRTVDHMVADYEQVLTAMASSLGLGVFEATPQQRNLQRGIDGVVGLKKVEEGQGALLAELKQSVANRDIQLGEARQIIHQFEARIAARELELIEREQDLATLEKKREWLDIELQDVYQSRSWRLTGGLRALTVQCRRFLALSKALLRFVAREIWHPVRMVKRVLTILRQPRLGGLRHFVELHAGTPRATQTSTAETTVTAVNISEEYRELNEGLSVNSRIRAIAFYLPQFHPIPENDEWWGRGFTEWTNVTRAVPQFEGHYQPHLPGELGFYDLRLPEVQLRQMALAKNYGLSGFCYYYYWFSGRRLLERPLAQQLENPEMDFPFCVCWANENWTRRWDGKDADILMAQRYRPEDAEQFILDLLPILLDSRYIRVDGRVVLLVYRVDQIPDCATVADLWRRLCIEHGVGDPLLVAVQSFDIEDPRIFGFDAAVEFPPHRTHPVPPSGNVQPLNPDYSGQILDYTSLIPEKIIWPEYRVFRGVIPSWDNEARRPGRGSTFVNSVPSNYRKWLDVICNATDDHYAGQDEKLVFINAWNEWAEGAHLEPDRRFGYAFLQATADVLGTYPRKQLELILSTQHKREEIAKYAVVLNLFYDDLWEEVAAFLDNLEGFDLYISVRPSLKPAVLADILTRYPSVELAVFPNRGRDIGPFFGMMARISSLNYQYICKIHSKKSLHRGDGAQWRRDLLGKLLGSRARIAHIMSLFDSNPDVGLIGPEDHLVLGTTFWGANEACVKTVAAQMGVSVIPKEFSFFAGSMFWFRPAALQPLLALGFTPESFESESGQVDGTLAHAIERLFPLAVEKAGFRVIDTATTNSSSGAGVKQYDFCSSH